MSWLARLKNKTGTELDASIATKGSFIAFIASTPTPFENSMSAFVGLAGDGAGFRMNELDTSRLALFMDRGLTEDEAQILANRLDARDLNGDDRRVCLECLHLYGTVARRRCSQWRKLGINSPAVPAELSDILQRCSSFNFRIGVTA